MKFRVAVVAFAAVAAFAADSATAAPPDIASLLAACETYNEIKVCSGQVPSFDGSPLDVDLTFPKQESAREKPLIVLLHGYGQDKREWESTRDEGDEADKYYWNSHWFARHGYYVLTYTARGLPSIPVPNRSDQPATPHGTSLSLPYGKIHLKNREFEIRDT